MYFLYRILPYIGPAIRYADNPNRNPWRIDLALFAIFVWLCDIVVARLWFNPQGYERTVSDTLERLAVDKEHPHWWAHYCLAYYINVQSPGHIKSINK